MSQLLPTDKFSFQYVLNELNYGALETDKRPTKIFKALKSSITQLTSLNMYTWMIAIDTFSRYKEKRKKKIFLTWEFIIHEFKTPELFFQKAEMSNLVDLSNGNYQAYLHLHINKGEGISDKKLNEQITELIKTRQFEITLVHEIKHLVDNVEEVFTDKHYFIPTDVTDFKQYQKYISQNEEIDSQLISVLLELEEIKKKNPKIELEQALEKSTRYEVFVKYLRPSKLSKYKQKIFYYWRTKLNKEK